MTDGITSLANEVGKTFVRGLRQKNYNKFTIYA